MCRCLAREPLAALPPVKEAALSSRRAPSADVLKVKEDTALQQAVRGARRQHALGGFPRFESLLADAKNFTQRQE